MAKYEARQWFPYVSIALGLAVSVAVGISTWQSCEDFATSIEEYLEKNFPSSAPSQPSPTVAPNSPSASPTMTIIGLEGDGQPLPSTAPTPEQTLGATATASYTQK